jgi:phage terminase large subunit
MEKISNATARKIKRALQLSPSFFNHAVLGGDFWSKQEEIALSVRDNRYTTVRACHDVGKTYVAARLALWFLYSHPQSIVVTTAPTMRQVENLLWRELRAAHEKAKVLEGEPLKTRLDLASDWYAIGASSSDPDKLQGFHAASGHILIIADEAAGIPEPAFEAMEGMMTSEDARMVMIGNPTSDTGSFRDSHYRWEHANKIHISVFDSPNFKNNGISTVEELKEFDLGKVEIVNKFLVSPQWVLEKLNSWGIDSPMFQARVLGNFPSQSANTVIPLNALEVASSDEHREKLEAQGGPFYLGVDVARFGNDYTVLTPRYGGFIPHQTKHASTSIPETVGLIKQYGNPRPTGIYIDVDGLGGGVYDVLREQKYNNVIQIHNNAKALPDSSGLTFANLASQLWWRAREMFIAGELAIPNDEKLIMQLSTRKYSFGSRGLTVESKDDWKKRHGGKSCDEGDSLIYSLGDILGNETRVQATAGKNVSELIGRRLRE